MKETVYTNVNTKTTELLFTTFMEDRTTINIRLNDTNLEHIHNLNVSHVGSLVFICAYTRSGSIIEAGGGDRVPNSPLTL